MGLRLAGGLALARHVLDAPEAVRGRRVLDLGCGSGLVALAAARAGAARVLAVDADPYAAVAARLNAEAAGAAVEVRCADALAGPPPAGVDLVLAGDLFYAEDLAVRSTAFLDRCAAAGLEAWVGDPGRSALPRERLRLLSEHPVDDVGEAVSSGLTIAAAYAWV